MRVRLRASIGATIFGAFVAMGLLIAVLGGYGFFVLQSAGGGQLRGGHLRGGGLQFAPLLTQRWYVQRRRV